MDNKYEIVKFQQDDLTLDVSVSPLEETVWLSKEDMSQLFNRDRSVISRHIKNIFQSNELDEKSNVHFLHIPNSDKPVPFYSLDVVISVGYKVKSNNGIIFRKWATSVLKEYLLKGYVINENRATITEENYLNLVNKVENVDSRLSQLEKDQNYFFKHQIIFENRIFEALAIINDIISKAASSIILIDPYCDINTLNALKGKDYSVDLKIITSSKAKLSKIDINAFKQEYGNIIVTIDDIYHDRYLIIDDNYFYHLGSSVNYLGRRFSQISLVKDKDIINVLKNRV